MSNTAQGSPDGPRFIYGRKNVNWQGPQQAAQGSFSADAMEDFATSHIASNPLSLVNLDDALHDTIEKYSDNIALQSIQAPQTQHEIHDAIMQLHEKHLLEAVDDEGSTVNVGAMNILQHKLNPALKYHQELTTAFQPDDNLIFGVTLESINALKMDFTEFQKRVSKHPQLHSRKEQEKLAAFEQRIDNGEMLEVIEQCILSNDTDTISTHVNNGVFNRATAEDVILSCYAQTLQHHQEGDPDVDYPKDYVVEQVHKLRDSVIVDTIELPQGSAALESAQQVLPNIMKAKQLFPGYLGEKSKEIYEQFAYNLVSLRNLYGQDPEVNNEIDDMIISMVDNAEQAFAYEALVVDHARAERLAQEYGVEPEMEKWEHEDYSSFSPVAGSFDEKMEQQGDDFNLFNNVSYHDMFTAYDGSLQPAKVENAGVADSVAKQLDNTTNRSNPLASQSGDGFADTVDSLAQHAHKVGVPYVRSQPVSDIANHAHHDPQPRFFSRKDFLDYQNYVDASQAYQSSSGMKKRFSQSPQNYQPSFIDAHQARHNHATQLIEKAYEVAVASSPTMEKTQQWDNYDTFMQEVQRISALPHTGIKSNAQKGAIIAQLYHQIIE